MEFKELSTNEFKQDAIGSFNITSSGFRLALLGSTSEVCVLEMIYSPISSKAFPYVIEYVDLPSQRPSGNIINSVDMKTIYANSNVLERHELSVDPVYASHFAEEPSKLQVTQITWAPATNIFSKPLLAVVTNFGACHILQKNPISRHWNDLRFDVNKNYSEIFPFNLSMLMQKIQKHSELTEIVENHRITAFVWTKSKIFYTANASGWIVAFQFTKSGDRIQQYCQFKTDMGQISYLKEFDDFILASGSNGVVKIFEISHFVEDADDNHSKPEAYIFETECLWSKSDRNSCRKAEVVFYPKTNGYLIVFIKGSHILAYRLSSKGKLLSSCTLYVGCMKITGLEMLSHNEFIITTIAGMVKYIRILCDFSTHTSELQIAERLIKTGFDVANYQILGIAASPNKCLWSFVLFHNKDYTHQSKYSSNIAFVSVCSLSTQDPFGCLVQRAIPALDPFLDCAEIVRLEILNNVCFDKYNSFNALSDPLQINDFFLQKLQIRLMIVRAMIKYQREKFKNVKKAMTIELCFLNRLIQIVHIACRLKHLNTIARNELTTFQLLAGMCLKTKLTELVKEVQPADQEDLFKEIYDKLVTELTIITNECHIAFDNTIEQCIYCSLSVDSTTMVCAENHKIPRCCVSYVQVPIFYQRFCAECNTPAVADESKLITLFAKGDKIKCTFCRFTFSIVDIA